MMPWTSISGVASCALVAAVIVQALLPIARRSAAVRLVVGLILFGLMFIPIDGLVLAGYVRGVIGDPSVTTLVLMMCIAVRQVTGRELFDDRNLAATMALILLGAMFLYPMGMGLGPYDPFRLGFGSWWFYGVLFAVGLACWWKQFVLPLLCLTFGVPAFAVGLFESTNLWTYLIDPIAVVVAAGWFIDRCIRSVVRMRQAPEAVA